MIGSVAFYSRGLLKALLVSASLLASQFSLAIEAGDLAPPISLPSVNGNFSLESLKGKVVYLDFWASWCGPCRQSFPWMNSMHKKYSSQGLVIVAVNLDQSASDATRFLEKTPADFLVAFDEKGLSPISYGVRGMPTSLVIDRNGKVIAKHMGFNNEQREKLEQMILSALEQQK
jgi:thiol-disulfide isomerase/thioredoxin